MGSQRLLVAAFGVLTLAVAPSRLEAGLPSTVKPEEIQEATRDPKELTAKINQYVSAAWKAKGAKPTRKTDDREFLRRVFLDMGGRIPKVGEVLDYGDFREDIRREQLVEELFKRPEFVRHFSTTWSHLLIPADNQQMGRFQGNGMEVWLRTKFTSNNPADKIRFDTLARELLTAANNNQGAGLFFQSRMNKPEEVASATSRLFMGVKLECAQCHDHPFARWKRDQFWENAALFTANNKREISYEDKKGEKKVVKARFLDGSEPREGVDSKAALVEWLTKADNQFFGRAIANRMWEHFFGVGLVDPVDDLHDQNPASHPELLDELARQFAAHDFDLKFLIRAIVMSDAYQLASAIDPSTRKKDGENPEDDPRLFTRMNLKGLSPEQLFDSIITASDAEKYQGNPRDFNMGFGQLTPRSEFLIKFANQSNRIEYHTTILQALTLMNGDFAMKVTSKEESKLLQKVLGDPLDTPQRIEALYLAVFCRKPRADEAERLVKYVEAGGPKNNKETALCDVFWVLLNSAEFILNH